MLSKSHETIPLMSLDVSTVDVRYIKEEKAKNLSFNICTVEYSKTQLHFCIFVYQPILAAVMFTSHKLD
jgi:hypothetical protein